MVDYFKKLDYLKILKFIGSKVFKYVQVFIFPTKSVMSVAYEMSSRLIKMLSSERANVGSVVFDTYFVQNAKIKRLKESTTVDVNITLIGSLLSLYRVTMSVSFALMSFFYFFLSLIMPTVFLPFFVNIFGKNSIETFSILFVFSSIYYIFLMIFMMIRGLKSDKNTHKKYFQMMLKSEFEYIYLKCIEFDTELANLTMKQIVETLLLKSSKKEIEVNSQKFEKIIGEK